MDWSLILSEIVHGSLKTMLMIMAILMPLMVGLELIKDANWLDKAAYLLRPLMRLFRLPKEGAFPLLAGVFFGISYGSGVIIPFAREGCLSRRDLTLIGLFLAICHGMIEDPLIFTAIGANWWAVVLVRTGTAFLLLLFMSRVMKPNEPVSAPQDTDAACARAEAEAPEP